MIIFCDNINEKRISIVRTTLHDLSSQLTSPHTSSNNNDSPDIRQGGSMQQYFLKAQFEYEKNAFSTD